MENTLQAHTKTVKFSSGFVQNHEFTSIGDLNAGDFFNIPVVIDLDQPFRLSRYSDTRDSWVDVDKSQFEISSSGVKFTKKQECENSSKYKLLYRPKNYTVKYPFGT